jgi:hypothetical protein
VTAVIFLLGHAEASVCNNAHKPWHHRLTQIYYYRIHDIVLSPRYVCSVRGHIMLLLQSIHEVV